MRGVSADKNKLVLQAVTKLKILRGQLEGCSEDVKDLVLLILSYFNEKEENLFCYVEETCTAKEVQVESLPGTPCVIVCGKFICFTDGACARVRKYYKYKNVLAGMPLFSNCIFLQEHHVMLQSNSC